MYNLVDFRTVTESCRHLHCVITGHFTTLQRNPLPLAVTPSARFPHGPMAATDLFSVSTGFPIVDTSHTQNRVTCRVLCLA